MQRVVGGDVGDLAGDEDTGALRRVAVERCDVNQPGVHGPG